MVSGYDIPFTVNSRTGRWATPANMPRQDVPASVWRAKENNLRVRGVQLFNLLPAVLRNANHGDVLMWKNNLDHYLSEVPDQPTMHGLHQVPMMGGWG